jgi:hypothetical protein
MGALERASQADSPVGKKVRSEFFGSKLEEAFMR